MAPKTPGSHATLRELADIAAAIVAQIKPCYAPPYPKEVDLSKVRTTLDLRLNADGSLASQPIVIGVTGVSDENRSYVEEIQEAARRAVLLCAPLRLPAALYKGGWDHIQASFVSGAGH